MNIQLPYSAIKNHLNTNATGEQFAQSLALSGPSIERWSTSTDGDTVFDIEITVNRIDTACSIGIAQEASAILPRFGYTAKWINNPLLSHKFSDITFGTENPLQLSVDESACSRFTAVLLDSVQIKESPSFIADFLEKAGVRVINNVVDISNFLMLTMGQPVHTFDYDKIKKGVMKLRTSSKGESISLLDGKTYELPGNDIVIEDGSGRLIDLCGIMGGSLSEVDENTKRVLLFVQTYDGVRIRRTSMKTGARSVASSFFERGVDSNRVEPTLVYGVKLLMEHARARVASKLIDRQLDSSEAVPIPVSISYINDRMGTKVTVEEIIKILQSLGFSVMHSAGELHVTVPFWRKNDVLQPEDILEEVARIYGYHRLGEKIPPLVFIDDAEIQKFSKKLRIVGEIKHYLRDRGLFEMYTYSAYGEYDIAAFGLEKNDHLKIQNPISSELVYMRRSLLPSLFEVIKTNARDEQIRVFEIANVYIPRENELPLEESRICIMMTDAYSEIKGIVDNLMKILNITVDYKTAKNDSYFSSAYAEIVVDGKQCGTIGKLHSRLSREAGKTEVVFAEIACDALVDQYKEMFPFPKRMGSAVIEDITYRYNKKIDFTSVRFALLKKYPEIQRIGWVSQYEDFITIRIYSRPEKNISILNHIIVFLESELGLEVKKPEIGKSMS